MAFGQPSGPPATGKQLQELMQLLNAAGHTDFRDARGPMGFTQRQAGGKFTRDEADAFIAQLQEWAEIAEAADAVPEPARLHMRRARHGECLQVHIIIAGLHSLHSIAPARLCCERGG